jgi:hypothetical protein
LPGSRDYGFMNPEVLSLAPGQAGGKSLLRRGAACPVAPA